MKKILKSIIAIILALVLIVVGYFAYVLISYHRIEDNVALDVTSTGDIEDTVTTNKTYRIASSNTGFGAYSDDYSFFMDGGKESWAYSKDAVITNITGTAESCMSVNPDFYLFQEVDLNSTRTYHVNEEDLFMNLLSSDNNNYDYTFAINYDSPFLMYPLTQPHGKSKAGLLTVSSVAIISSIRRQLPIETGLSKLIDLDRSYSKNYINVDNGKQLVIYNCHLSAYTTDPSTAINQLKMINEDMLSEYNAGNYVIFGGDMNKDLLGDSSEYFGVKNNEVFWAQPFPTDVLSEELTLVAPFDEENPVPTCRNADIPYTDETFVITIDGFIISPNVELVDANVINTEFKYSDHNPVYMDFILK